MRTKYDDRLSKEFKYSVGLNISETTGTENFSSRDSLGNPGPHPITDFSGYRFRTFCGRRIPAVGLVQIGCRRKI